MGLVTKGMEPHQRLLTKGMGTSSLLIKVYRQIINGFSRVTTLIDGISKVF